MLDAYEQALDSGTEIDKGYSGNQYYNEFVDRRELLFANIENSTSDIEGRRKIYQNNIDSINSAI